MLIADRHRQARSVLLHGDEHAWMRLCALPSRNVLHLLLVLPQALVLVLGLVCLQIFCQ
jgi:hypothetical protein